MKQFSGKVMLIYEINKTIFDVVVSRCVFSVVLSERSMTQSHLEMNKFALLTKLGVTVFYCYYYCRCKLRLFFHPFVHLVVRGFISLFVPFVRSFVRVSAARLLRTLYCLTGEQSCVNGWGKHCYKCGHA